MPEICRFLGIVIYMLYDDHSPPHFHAEYSEYKITVELRKNTPDGQLRGTLAIHTDDAKQSTLTVPFYGIIGSFEG